MSFCKHTKRRRKSSIYAVPFSSTYIPSLCHCVQTFMLSLHRFVPVKVNNNFHTAKYHDQFPVLVSLPSSVPFVMSPANATLPPTVWAGVIQSSTLDHFSHGFSSHPQLSMLVCPMHRSSNFYFPLFLLKESQVGSCLKIIYRSVCC